MRAGGTVGETLRNTLDLARHAEEWGYTRYWLAEHHNMAGIASAATAVLIGYVAGGTSRIRVGSGGIMLPNHPSLVIAEQFGTLESLYPGRIDLGLGRAPGSDGLTMRALRRGVVESEEDFPRQVSELLELLGPEQAGKRLRAFPGQGTGVPLWLLGSSTFSAQLAAKLGLPFAFASHFAPALLEEAIHVYRRNFQASATLEKPYVMAGVPFVAAETDERARYLATTPLQRALSLMRGGPIYLQPPVESMDGRWTQAERWMVESKLGVMITGGPETVRTKLEEFVTYAGLDEVMFICDLYEHADRLKSFEIVAQVMNSSVGAAAR